MATGIINPHAVATPNTRYRDAVLADNPMSLWMLDEPYGNDVATDQGNSPSDGTYYGALSTDSTRRGSRTIFGLDAIGNATNGVGVGQVNCPLNAANQAVMNSTSGFHDLSFEFLLHIDVLGYENYPIWAWSPWYIMFRNTNRLEGRFYSNTGQNDYAWSPTTSISAGTDYHCVLGIAGSSSNRSYYWYVNGAMVSQSLLAGGWGGMTVSSIMQVARFGLHGGMAGLAIYDYFLGGYKVNQHYNALL